MVPAIESADLFQGWARAAAKQSPAPTQLPHRKELPRWVANQP
jgi:hypothetical protein